MWFSSIVVFPCLLFVVAVRGPFNLAVSASCSLGSKAISGLAIEHAWNGLSIQPERPGSSSTILAGEVSPLPLVLVSSSSSSRGSETRFAHVQRRCRLYPTVLYIRRERLRPWNLTGGGSMQISVGSTDRFWRRGPHGWKPRQTCARLDSRFC